MAYINQEKKKDILKNLKPIIKKYDLGGSLSINHHSTLVLTISSGSIDFISNYNQLAINEGGRRIEKDLYLSVNTYHYKSHFSGIALEALTEIMEVLNEGNFDHSDSQSDYFHVGWYVDINIGRWNKSYQLKEGDQK